MYFFLLGDTGSGDQNQYDVAGAMERRCLELPQVNGMFLLGDLFYMTGVSGLNDPQWKDKIETPYSTPCLSKVNMYPIFGNHDYKGDKESFLLYRNENPRWKMPGRFYSVDFSIALVPREGKTGDPDAENRKSTDPRTFIKFIALDSNFTDFCLSPKDCVVDFLTEELDSPAFWKVVLAHYPLSSSSKKKYQYTGETAFGYLYRWLACDKTNAWVSGHAHFLEHRKIPNCSADLFVSGGGGGELDSINEGNRESKFASSQFGFMEMEVAQSTIKVRFFAKDSKILYEYEMHRK